MSGPRLPRHRAAILAVLLGAGLWQAWTARAMSTLDRRQLIRLLGAVPDGPPPLAPEPLERVDLGDVVREKVSYAVEPGERVPAFLFLPRTGGPRARTARPTRGRGSGRCPRRPPRSRAERSR